MKGPALTLPPTAEVVRIPFRDGEVLAVDRDGKPNIFLKPVIDGLGIDYSTQVRKLKAKSWASVGTMPTQLPNDSQTREHVVVDVRTFLMLLATIDEHRVSDEARESLIAYQNEVADVIEAYWTQGGAINPRATEDQLTAIINRAEGQARVLKALGGIVDAAWLEAKGRHVAARALGEEPEISLDSRPLTVGEYLQDKGVTGAALRAMSTGFGKKVKALYIQRYDTEPPMVERFVDGALRDVKGYTEAHRNLFDVVWASYADEGVAA